MCLRWILELPPPKLEEVLGELRWLHPQVLEDLPDSEAAELMSRYYLRAEHIRMYLEIMLLLLLLLFLLVIVVVVAVAVCCCFADRLL